MNLKVVLFNLIALHIACYGNAQVLKALGSSTDLYSSYEIQIDNDRFYEFEFAKPATSLSLIFPADNILSTYIVANGDTIYFQIDSHIFAETGILSSSLIVFNSVVEKISFYSGDLVGDVKVHLNHTPALLLSKNKRSTSGSPCTEPSMLYPSSWRDGLSVPVNLPECSEVEHVIVHHSATSNSVSNYEQVVRDIYVFHTKPVANGGRGYDDIAYNFLIDPEGTIYQGRDDQGVCDKDNVKGAHMCGRNTNTMGICLLGTFTNIKPTEKALNALHQLIGWKLNKEGISAYGSSWHPVINPAVLLGNIAGHREGCNPGYTECPGDSVYYHLNDIRDSVNQIMSYCIPASVVNYESGIKLYPQPADGAIYINGLNNTASIKIISSFGNIVKQINTSASSLKVNVEDLAEGIYFLEVTSTGKYLYKKIIIE